MTPATMCRGSATLYGADALEQAALLSAVALIFHTLLFSNHNKISPMNRSICNAYQTESLVPNGSIRIRVSLQPLPTSVSICIPPPQLITIIYFHPILGIGGVLWVRAIFKARSPPPGQHGKICLLFAIRLDVRDNSWMGI